MKRLLIFLLLAACALYAKDRQWQDGKLVAVTVNNQNVPSRVNPYGNIRSYQAIDFYITVSDGKIQYYAGRQVWAERDMPHLTENSPIKFVIEKDSLIIRDERGKEFKARITKKTAL